MPMMRRAVRRVARVALLAAAALLPFAQADARSSPHPRSTISRVSLSPHWKATHAGSNLSPTLLPSYAGIGIEPSNLPAIVGTDSVNALTFGCLEALQNLTGEPPHLRIGGNTGDNALWNATATGYGYTTNASAAGPTSQLYFGPGLFKAIDRLPESTPITFGLNAAYNGSDALDRITEEAAAALKHLTNVKLVGFEVGNEPDLWVTNRYRAAGFTEHMFGQEWIKRVTSIYKNVLLPRGRPAAMFEAAVTATTANKNGHPYRVADLTQDANGVGHNDSMFVAGWSQHDYLYYINVSEFPITINWLLSLPNTVTQFYEWQQQALQAQQTGKPYYLREMGSVGPEGIKGISDTFANTLWTFNFFLYAATQHVNSVEIHMTQSSYSAPWQPIEMDGTGAHVRSSFYAFAAFAQIVGANCNTRVAPVDLDLSDAPRNYAKRLAAYAIYTGDDITGLALVNTHPHNTTSSRNGTVSFGITIPTLANRAWYVSALTAPGTDATHNTTWNGMSYETQPNAQAQQVTQTGRKLTSDGSGLVHVHVPDGSAAVLSLDAVLGSSGSKARSNCASVNRGGNFSTQQRRASAADAASAHARYARRRTHSVPRRLA